MFLIIKFILLKRRECKNKKYIRDFIVEMDYTYGNFFRTNCFFFVLFVCIFNFFFFINRVI